jgi:hypothetical protein
VRSRNILFRDLSKSAARVNVACHESGVGGISAGNPR